MLDERRLDLDRRDPQAADLDHVVGPALVPVVAVLVHAVAVAAEEPLAEDRVLGLLVLRPVERQRAVALHVQVSGLARGHGLAVRIEDLHLVAGHGLAAGSRPEVVEPVRAVDVEHLGRADAVEDDQAEGVLPALPDLCGQ